MILHKKKLFKRKIITIILNWKVETILIINNQILTIIIIINLKKIIKVIFNTITMRIII